MLGFLFVDDADLVVDDAAVGGLKDSAPAVLDAAIGALEGPGGAEWTTSRLEESLRAAIVDGLGIKPHRIPHSSQGNRPSPMYGYCRSHYRAA